MSYWRNEEFMQLYRAESRKKRESLQILTMTFVTIFTASFLGVMYMWDSLLYEGAQLFISVLCILSFLIACLTIYETVIYPFNKTIEKWKRSKAIGETRAILVKSPANTTSPEETSPVNESEMDSEIAQSPPPILNYRSSPRTARPRPDQHRVAIPAPARNAPEPANNPLPLLDIPASPRVLRPRTKAIVVKPKERNRRVGTVPSAVKFLVSAEVHREDEPSSPEHLV